MPNSDSASSGASSRTRGSSGAGSSASNGAAGKLAAQLRHQAGRLKDQGITKASQFAESGKDQVAAKLDEVASAVSALAQSTEGQYGPAAGQYVRRAAETVSSAAEGLRNRSVHGLVSDSRTAIRDNAGVAIGTAALLGFAAARVAKGGIQANDEDAALQTQAADTLEPAGAMA